MAQKKHKEWFDIDLAKMLADKIVKVEPQLNRKRFIQSIDKGVQDLELKARIEWIADQFHLFLGEDYKKVISVLQNILGKENENETGMFTEFYWAMPIAKYIEKYGLDDFTISMEAIKEVTKRNTGEYAIRPYLEKNTDRTLKMMFKWSKDKNFHVRRLSCEGVRPRLPWGKKLDIFIENPKMIFPILENLKDDPSKYVQKSVANCINDIFKDNLEIGKEIVESWNQKEISTERKWIIKHALRKLLKAEDSWAKKMISK